MNIREIIEQEDVCPQCLDAKWQVPADWNEEYGCCQWCVDEMLADDDAPDFIPGQYDNTGIESIFAL